MPRKPYTQYILDRDAFAEAMLDYQEALSKLPTIVELAKSSGMKNPRRLYEHMDRIKAKREKK